MTTTRRTAFRRLSIGIGSVLALAAVPAFAMDSGAMDHGAMDHAQMDKPAPSSMTEGEVRKIDVDLGQITLKHAEIKNLGMPGMTMVFTAKDKVLLSGLKAGDRIKFSALRENGKLMVTSIEAVPAE